MRPGFVLARGKGAEGGRKVGTSQFFSSARRIFQTRENGRHLAIPKAVSRLAPGPGSQDRICHGQVHRKAANWRTFLEMPARICPTQGATDWIEEAAAAAAAAAEAPSGGSRWPAPVGPAHGVLASTMT
eukprot:scaffold1588_cov408-Prasinococcus_capsulatus_cf.AAC.13